MQKTLTFTILSEDCRGPPGLAMTANGNFSAEPFEKTKPILRKGKSDKAKGKRNQEFYALMLLCTFALFAKQTQFLEGKKNVSVYLKGHYGNYCSFEQRKNKANIMVHSSWFIVHGKELLKAT